MLRVKWVKSKIKPKITVVGRMILRDPNRSIMRPISGAVNAFTRLWRVKAKEAAARVV